MQGVVLLLLVAVASCSSPASLCEGGNGAPCGANVVSSYDYVVVGSAAGDVVASRLAEAGARVLLVQDDVADATDSVPAASGSSIYVRGHRLDYEEWETKYTAAGWSWRDIKPYFIKSEAMTIKNLANPLYHGTEGPLPVSNLRYLHGASARFVKSAAEFGIPRTEDYNGAQHQGVAPFQVNQLNGLTVTLPEAYTQHAQSKFGANLTVVSASSVSRLLFDQTDETKVVGVVFNSLAGVEQSAVATRDVILSLGAIQTPRVLMLSGIGNKPELEMLDIKVVVDSPQVGANLQYHTRSCLTYSLSPAAAVEIKNASDAVDSSLNNDLTFSASTTSMANIAKYVQTGEGPLSSPGFEAAAFVMTGESEDIGFRPDVALLFAPALDTNPNTWASSASGMSICATLLHPRSRGRVALSSSSPSDAPVVESHTLQNQRDVDALVQGLKLGHMITRQPSFMDVQPTLYAKEGTKDNAFWTELAKAGALSSPLTSPSSTCMISTKRETGVVDLKLRVHGVKGLRIVDSSVFPTVPGGIGNAPVVAFAERAADMIQREFRGLPELDVTTIAADGGQGGKGGSFPAAKPAPKKKK